MDKFRIDGHKLNYHLDRVKDWSDGKDVYPIYMEISPSGSCNHRCVYCALDFMEYQPRFLKTAPLKERLTEMGKLGVKSIMYAGEGEPFLHPDISGIIAHTQKSGIDVAVTSNGALFSKEIADAALKYITWIKISINAATPETYAKIHRARPEDFPRVMENLAYAAEVRRKKKYSCALGMQIILLPENSHEIELLAKKAREIGMDYLVVKPYSQHPFSKTTRYSRIKYSRYLGLAQKLAKFNTDKFNVVFRVHAMQKWDQARHAYQHCLALPFWAHIDAGGGVWACSVYLSLRNDNMFYLGNIYEKTFRGIWRGERRRKLMLLARGKMDTSKCRVNCRMDEINRYLWGLKNPPEHVNFI